MAAISKFKKGDKVLVTTGRDKGKTGEILKVLPKKHRVIIQGVNKVKRHTRPTNTSPGGVLDIEATIDVSIFHILTQKIIRQRGLDLDC